MPRVSRTRVIQAPRADVWNVVCDPHHLPRWWPRALRVEDVMDPPLAPPTAAVAPVVTYPDELLETAMRKLLEHEVDVLPVASPDDPTRVVGFVERSAILGAWVQLTRDEHIREEGWLARLRRASR